ncbi:16S rRNA methyltransferase [Buchnera aphidicola (Aphis helianthi)]|uniref:Ribosomal RNA small subunit methyltransferase J n=1 Tax=Buchnera aphidicola (Aphis helianthi) TaxID=2315802 RepID=A0A4D6XSD8_9GAMM|nr:class I SAM-dependent methyltransferase [Buchnera aphidicola]QCI17380.1 16S rRNA methyltransferase [Buchnera aphidicola (Aphis helianthi)]
MNIYLITRNINTRIQKIINDYNIKHDENASLALIINNNTLELYNRLESRKKIIKVDFLSNQNNYRCSNFKKKNEALYKALGIKKNYFPYVVDATAGFGKDAFLISFWGCYVVMIERHPIIAALLKDGLQRAYENKNIGNWLKKRLHLMFSDSCKILNTSMLKPDIIYLDPMYPTNKKKALPKKNIQFLRNIIQNNDNCENLLNVSRKFAKKRIIVKRPSYAKPLSNEKVEFSINNKNNRFDIYLPFK